MLLFVGEKTHSFYEMAPRDIWHIHNIAITLESNEYKYVQQNLSLSDSDVVTSTEKSAL